MGPGTTTQQQSNQIGIEKDPDPKENRVYASLFAFARFNIGNCSDLP